MTPSAHKTRALIVVVALSLGFSVLAVRLVDLHVLQHKELAAEALANREQVVHRQGRRGEIRDCNGNLLANSQSVRIVYADPTITRPNAATIAGTLAPVLGMDPAGLRSPAQRPGPVRPSETEGGRGYRAEGSGAEDSKGIVFEDQFVRSYPDGTLASHVIGFVDDDAQGRAGHRGGDG